MLVGIAGQLVSFFPKWVSGTAVPPAAPARPGMPPVDTMTPHEILSILDKHERWLGKRQGGVRANLAMEDLRGLHLASVVLRHSKLSGTVMSGCDLCTGPTCAVRICA